MKTRRTLAVLVFPTLLAAHLTGSGIGPAEILILLVLLIVLSPIVAVVILVNNLHVKNRRGRR